MTDEVKAFLDYARYDCGESGLDADKFARLAAAAITSLNRATLAAAGQNAPEHGVHDLVMPLLIYAADTLAKSLRSEFPEAGDVADGLAEFFFPMTVTKPIQEVD